MLNRRLFSGIALASCGLAAITAPQAAQAATLVAEKGPITNSGPNAGNTCTGFFSVGQVTGVDTEFSIFGQPRDIIEFEVTGADGTVYFENKSTVPVGQTQSLAVFVVIPQNDAAFPVTITIYDSVTNGVVLSTADSTRGAVLGSVSYTQADLPNCAFTFSNQTPVANAGSDQGSVAAGSNVVLNGSASSDPENDPLTYSWVQTSGPPVTLSDTTAVSPSFAVPANAAGATFTFDLIVNDGTTSSTADSVSITVATNQPPVADAGADQGPLLPGGSATLDGSASSDPDGDALTYSWVQTSGPAVTLDDATAAMPTFAIPVAAAGATLTFDLVVNDGTVSSAADSVSITIRSNETPVANAGADLGPVLPGDMVTLNGGASSDADGDNLTYSWVQTSGPSVTLDNPNSASPSFTVPANSFGQAITFELIVNDGIVSSTTDSVTVNVRSNAAPVADAGGDMTNIIPGSEVSLDGSGSSDADGDAITYSWTQVSGPAVTLVGANTATPSFTAPAESGGAPIVLRLIVNDGFVDSQPDTISIAVIDNVAAAQQAIGDFMAQRANLLLSHQPDLQRRIDRLEGNGSGRGPSSVAGLAIPGSERLPAQITVANGIATGSANVSLSDGSRDGGAKGSIDLWAEGYFQSFDYSGRDGDATILYTGIDYALSDDLLIGVMAQYDDIGFDKSVTTGVLSGEGWMVGPYTTARLAPDLFLDARAAFGSSTNTVSPFGTYTDEFDANRTLLSATLTGQLKAGESFTIRPEANISWFKESSEDFVDGLGSTVGGVDVELGQVSFAPRAMYNASVGEGWTLRPFVEARGILSWGDDRARILSDDFRMRLEGGLDLLSEGGFRASVSGFRDGIGVKNYSSNGVHVTMGITF